MRIRVICLHNARTRRFMGGIQYENGLAGGELHTLKVTLLLKPANRTYEQLLHIVVRSILVLVLAGRSLRIPSPKCIQNCDVTCRHSSMTSIKANGEIVSFYSLFLFVCPDLCSIPPPISEHSCF